MFFLSKHICNVSDLNELQGKCTNLLLSALQIESKVLENSENVFIINDIACLEGEGRGATKQRNRRRTPVKMFLIWHPIPECLSLSSSSSKYIPNSMGDKTTPCFTPLDIMKVSEYTDLNMILE